MRGQGFYEKFDIIDLHQEQEFKRFYYIFNKANLIDEGEESAIETLVKNTTTQEENITKKFYEHYKEIRIKLLNHLFEHNPEVNNLVLVEKTQKLLDRLIFTMVCEDSSTLLPAQIVKNTYDRAFQSFALSDSDQRAWSEFKGLFHAIDKGNRRVMPPINAYNGGLFKYDEILDNLIIKDDVFDEIIKLTDYDFESELNVNVLGHIFEQSISDLEEIREAVNLLTENGGELLTEDGKKIALEQSKRKVVPKSGKRKKMGIFYTPEYITKYIVENTVGKYLEENPKKLESIKILDPACGSGAFLNQAHSFLLNEYKIRTEEKQLEKTKKGEMLTLWDTNTTENDKTILLDNLFGVDLSPESVDITKLALWLKTAKATEPLQNLDNNIKCGNSLIDDHEIVGERAFDWSKEFREVKNGGGFDVIIGNPPYVSTKQIPSNERDYFWKKFSNILQYEMDLYEIFMYKCFTDLLKKDGYLGFITPSSFYSTKSFKLLREYIFKELELISIVDFPYRFYPFDDVNTETCIHIYKKSKPSIHTVQLITAAKDKTLPEIVIESEHEIKQPDFTNTYEGKIVTKPSSTLKKIISQKHTLKEFATLHKGWMSVPKTTKIDSEVIDQGIFTKDELKSNPQLIEITSKYLEGRDIHRYYIDANQKFVNITDIDKKTKEWHQQPKIILQRIVGQNKRKIFATIDTEGQIIFPSANILNTINGESLYTVLAILNSDLIDHFYNNFYGESNTNVTKSAIESLPFPNIASANHGVFKENVENIIYEVARKNEAVENIVSLIKDEFSIEKIPTKFKKLDILGWNEFVEEFEKRKIKFDFKKKEEVHKWFLSKRKILQNIQNKIDVLEGAVNQEVYKLYGLNVNDIKNITK